MKKKEMKGGYNPFYNVPPMVSGAQGAVPVPFAPASTSSQYGGKKRGNKKTQKKQKGGFCPGSCMRGGAQPELSPAALA